MRGIRFYHWMVALSLAVVFHAAFIWGYPNEKDKELVQTAQQGGVVAFEIDLAAEAIKQSVPPPVKAQPKPVIEREVVEKKTIPATESISTSVVQSNVKSDIVITPKEEPVPKIVKTPVLTQEPEPAPMELVEKVVEARARDLTKPVKELVPQTLTEQVAMPSKQAPQEVQESVLAGRDKGLKDDYQATLSAWLEKHKSYPRRAKQRWQEGTAFLRFKIDNKGKLISYEIERSSGFKMLDKEVEKMLMRALPLPEMPDALGLNEMELILPVSFQLR